MSYFLADGMWEEVKQGDRWPETTYQENARDRKKGKEETGWGRCSQEDKETGRNYTRSAEKSHHSKTGTRNAVKPHFKTTSKLRPLYY